VDDGVDLRTTSGWHIRTDARFVRVERFVSGSRAFIWAEDRGVGAGLVGGMILGDMMDGGLFDGGGEEFEE
jgi:hypothetical protein